MRISAKKKQTKKSSRGLEPWVR